MVWLYSILAGFFCTLLINPLFYKRSIYALIYRNRAKAWLNANAEKNVSKFNLPSDIKKYDVTGKWEYDTIWGGIIAELIWYVVGFCYFKFFIFGLLCFDINFLSVISCMWAPFLVKVIISGCYYLLVEDKYSLLVLSLIMFVISVTVNITSGLYNFYNQKELSTVIIEPDVPVISEDISKTLENIQITDQDEKLLTPINRNGEIIYVLKNRESSSESAGYIEVKDESVKFVKYKFKYTPYTESSNAVKYRVREIIPDKIIFGDFSLQKDEDGTIYFACLYGHHTFLRGGKALEGMVYVNAETGETYTCTLEDIPSFMTGICE